MAEGNGSDNKKVKRPSALKRDIQHEKRRLQNKAFKAQVNTALRNFKNSLSSKDGIIEKLNTVFSLMDKGVKKGIYKINKAARVKSSLQRLAK